MRRLLAAILALIFATTSPASAATVFHTGTFNAGDNIYETLSGPYLGDGSYRFRFDLTGLVDGFFADALKTVTSIIYCEDENGPFNCGGDDVPSGGFFEQVSPTSYEALLSVNGHYIIGDPTTAHYENYEFCCSVDYGFVANTAGTFTISFTALPEPQVWLMMIVGIAGVSVALRRRPALAGALRP